VIYRPYMKTISNTLKPEGEAGNDEGRDTFRFCILFLFLFFPVRR
jgi:hypothetical protein